MSEPSFGLYIHVPFCAKLCHYCDFAKTANFSNQHVEDYFRVLEKQLQSWLDHLAPTQKFTSVFFGGGTPGLFTKEYAALFKCFQPRLTDDAEITLETNPHNINTDSLSYWKSLGVNRISIGVQSFDPQGLKALTRDHSSAEAIHAIVEARKVIANVNADLIYGWPGQSFDSWEQDLKQMIDLGVTHISLYALTFEGNTPFARAHRRGKLPAAADEIQERNYLEACELLRNVGYTHEEISNWSKDEYSCKHNWLYWSDGGFIGIGAGAHGYTLAGDFTGLRYSYPGDLRQYIRECDGDRMRGIQIDLERNADEWLMEYVGCGLRTKDGINLEKIRGHGWSFQPNAVVEQALRENIIELSGDTIKLAPKDWFRETAWSGHVLNGFKRS